MVDKVKEKILEEGYEDVVVFDNPDYESAFIGVSHDNRAIYDYNLMIESLMKEEGMTEEDAADFISYNTIRACDYIPNSPIILYPSLED